MIKIELKHLNKLALGILLFVSIYHAFNLFMHRSFGISFIFVLSSAFTVRTLLREEITAVSQKNNYLSVVIASWLALFFFLLEDSAASSLTSIWLSLAIICTAILLRPIQSFRINSIALFSYWLLALFYLDSSFAYIETALWLTVMLLVTAVINQQFHLLKSKLSIAKTTDQLTGCIQTQAFRSELDKVMQLHERYATPFSLISIQCQNDFNDEGDQNTWLKELAQLYKSRLRKTDILCRYNNHTFIALLPSTSNKNAKLLSLDLEKCADAYQFSYQQTNDIKPRITFTTKTYEKNTDLTNWLREIQS